MPSPEVQSVYADARDIGRKIGLQSEACLLTARLEPNQAAEVLRNAAAAIRAHSYHLDALAIQIEIEAAHERNSN